MDLLNACIRNGRTAQRLYKGNIRVMLRSPQSFLKQLHYRIFGFGTLFLACPGITMTSMCCNDHHCEADWRKSSSLPLYTFNGHECNMCYYLADGIYPPWATFVTTISNPVRQKKAHFAQRQEVARKDVERAFGVLQARLQLFVDLLNNAIRRPCGRL